MSDRHISSTARPARPIRVALINDYQLVVEGLRSVLEPYADRVEVVELSVDHRVRDEVDVAIYDTFAAPTGTAIDVDHLLNGRSVGKIVVYSFGGDDNVVRGVFAAGAAGFVSKTLDGPDLVDALERVVAGERVVERGDNSPLLVERWPGADAGLSVREAEILGLITQGLSNQDIAERCYLSINTIKTYIRTTYRKIGVQTRAQAVAWGMMHGMRPEPLNSSN